MKKWKKALKALGLIVRNPWLLNKVLDDTVWADYVEKQHLIPEGFPVVSRQQLGLGAPDVVYPYAFLDGGSLPTDLALLNSLVQKKNDCRYFEIGTWRGESVANVARFAKECVTLDLSAEQLRKYGRDANYIKAQAEFSKDLKNVSHLHGDTQVFDFRLLPKDFDVIFIDGDHHYEMVKNDTAKVVQHLYHKDCIIVWHDYAHNPEQVRFEVMAGILDGLPASLHPFLYHVENTKCAILYPHKIEGRKLTFPMEAKHVFEVKLEEKKLIR
jgi:predicted O-methyltransferase YrrM